MSDPRPAPPYPADTRAKGWRFELDYEKIEQSDTWDIASETPLAQQCLLMMWYVAWKQEPCGSFPSDEETIRAKCKVPAKLWPSLRRIMMRGWWLADDGRLYHDTIVARVCEMLEYRRKTAARVAKHKAATREKQGGNALPTGKDRRSNDTGTGTGTGTIEEKYPLPPGEGDASDLPCPFEDVVQRYHARLPGLPKVKVVTVPRQKAIRTRWKWVLSSLNGDGERRATTKDEALDWFGRFFDRAAQNDFLMGRTGRSVEHKNWQPDIDYLMSDRGLTQVLEKTQVQEVPA